MAQDEHKENDPDLDYLRRKMSTSAINTIEAMIEEPSVKRIIRRIFVREAIKQSIILSMLFIGIFTIYNALRQVMNWGLYGDLYMGIILILIAVSYLIKSLVS